MLDVNLHDLVLTAETLFTYIDRDADVCRYIRIHMPA